MIPPHPVNGSKSFPFDKGFDEVSNAFHHCDKRVEETTIEFKTEFLLGSITIFL
ncbi:MAG: hypothetical protein ACKVOR_02545 [Flavobacteriales bacterium]